MQSQRLPTRVSSGTACERCRRQKQRCEPLRPCSNCVNANHSCVPSTVLRPLKRARTSDNEMTPPRIAQAQYESPREREVRDAAQNRSSNRADSFTSASSMRPSVRHGREQSIIAEFGTSESAMDMTRRVLQSHQSPEDRATFAIPGVEFRERRQSVQGYYAIEDLVGTELPPKHVTDILLDNYFYTVHWFSLVVYEPSFRQRYEELISTSVAQTTDRPFLLLLLMVLVMSCQYGQNVNRNAIQGIDLDELRLRFLKSVRNSFIDLLEGDNLEFVQICILLGSYWLYWGKPRSSFTLLGTAIKSAQALYLHRNRTMTGLQVPVTKIEERKRVWWTIYTWDRFATVVYGRPLGINDRDCDIDMPAIFTEHLVDIRSMTEANVELSPYQSSLNQVYWIASPVLENIYSIRHSTATATFDVGETVKSVNEKLQVWSRELRPELDIHRICDLNSQSTLANKMHGLQALALQLTLLNLVIVVHRPFLADWRLRRAPISSANSPRRDQVTDTDQHIAQICFERCLASALDISRLGQEKPKLVALAGKTHLLSFMAMNIFTSSVVLFICASSGILTNEAQDAKKGMSRNLKMLRSLSHSGSLPQQCSTIVGDLIQMILDKEKEELLLDSQTSDIDDDLSDTPFSRSADAPSQQQQQHPSTNVFNNGTQPDPQLTTLHANRSAPNYSVHSEATFGRTMNQLHQVLKEATVPKSVPRATENNRQYLAGGSFPNQDVHTTLPPSDVETATGLHGFLPTDTAEMTQSWLWDFEPNVDFMADWSMTGHETARDW